MSLLVTIQRFLKQKRIEFATACPGVLKLGFADHNGVFVGYIQVDEEERMILVRTAAPLKAPVEERLQIAELLARLNPHIVFGNFEIDLPSGLITCKTSIILGRSGCHPDLVSRLLSANWWEMKRWFPAVEAVIIADLSPKQAVNMIAREHQPDDGDDVGVDDTFGRHLTAIKYGSMN